MADVVLLDHGAVAEIRLNRVAAHNALSTALAEELSAATGAVRDTRARAVVLTSADPKAFCVGADLKERDGLTDAGFLDQRLVFRRAFAGVRDLPVPVVAAVHGFALGGGYELALSANSPVAVAAARNAIRRGLGVDVAAGLDIEDSAWRAAAFSADRREGVRAFVERRTPNWP